MLLTQFDPNPRAVLNPQDGIPPIENFPRTGVACFSRVLFDRMIEAFQPRHIHTAYMANVDVPIYEIVFHGTRLAAFNAPVGAPACAAVCDELFGLGMEKLVLFGTCGVLDRSIADCSIIIPTAALRDEGVSYHYAPASDEIAVNSGHIDAFTAILDRHRCRYTIGKVWTTDAIYRETAGKIALRKAAGCVCVDMECASMAAVAQFRGKQLFHFFYAADNLDGDSWDERSLGNHVNLDAKIKIALLALEMASHMAAG